MEKMVIWLVFLAPMLFVYLVKVVSNKRGFWEELAQLYPCRGSGSQGVEYKPFTTHFEIEKNGRWYRKRRNIRVLILEDSIVIRMCWPLSILLPKIKVPRRDIEVDQMEKKSIILREEVYISFKDAPYIKLLANKSFLNAILNS